ERGRSLPRLAEAAYRSEAEAPRMATSGAGDRSLPHRPSPSTTRNFPTLVVQAKATKGVAICLPILRTQSAPCLAGRVEPSISKTADAYRSQEMQTASRHLCDSQQD